MPKFCGPFVIEKSLGPVTFALDLPTPIRERNIRNAFHVSLLRPYFEDSSNPKQPLPDPVSFDAESAEYEVDAVLQQRTRRGRKEYLVHWKGYPDTENSWVSHRDLNAQELLADFLSRASS